MLSQFCRKLFPSILRTSQPKPFHKPQLTPIGPRRRTLLQLETLEDRLTPATLDITGTSLR